MHELLVVAVYLLGLGLLFLELFIPSGGILGIVGTLCASFGIFMVFKEWPVVGVIITVVTIAYVVVIIRFWARRIKMTGSLAGSDSTAPEAVSAEVVGEEGVTLTVLRPAGFAMIGDRRLQVVTDGAFLAKGRKIRVVQVTGNRIVVTGIDEPIDEDDDDES